MTLKKFISQLEDRDDALHQMVARSRANRPDWWAGYNQVVYELIDLFEDHIPNSKYALQLKMEFDSAIQPNIEKLNKLSGLIKSAITRLERKPELFIDGADQATTDTFFSPAVTLKPPRSTVPEQLHRALMQRVSILEAMLAERPDAVPGIGHNKPPNDFPTTGEDVKEIEKLIDLLKLEPPKPAALPAAVVAQTKHVNELSKKFFDKCAESAGSELGKKLINVWFWYGLYSAVRDVVLAVGAWSGAL